ncbi:MAG: hypothetical protein ABIW03_05825 [Sphingomicrobium sp.]
MSGGRSFRSVFMVASCAGAALGCYLVSLRVASERAALEGVETRIVLTQRDIRLLQTEIGTRGRLAQLERWNVKVLALSAPTADQFLDGGFALARMVAPHHEVDLQAPVVLASAPADGPKPRIDSAPQDNPEGGVSVREMLHTASLKTDLGNDPEQPLAATAKLVPAAKLPVPANPKPKPARLAQADPLAPLTPKPAHATAKDTGRKQ